ncbi:MAG TPA: hypothetical protein PKA06_13065 [Gemmatales bacterium]|nr:hypothetical protein [Gemmatales bacterium]HMP16524.1 hypothetical protein [Gemmatales bacterium]
MPRSIRSMTVQRVRQGNGPEELLIEVVLPNRQVEQYHSLDEVPSHLRPLVQPLLEQMPDIPWDEALEDHFTVPVPVRRTNIQRAPKRCRVKQSPAKENSAKENSAKEYRAKRALELTYLWRDGWMLTACLIMMLVCLYPVWQAWKQAAGISFWPVFTLLLALLLLYLFLAYLLNRTLLKADDEGLEIRHGPLPWWGNRYLPRQDLIQLYVGIRTGSKSTTYSLNAITRYGTVVLLHDIVDPRELRQLEVLLEKRLQIQDVPVSGNQFR